MSPETAAIGIDYVILVAALAILGFLWGLHRDMRDLGERVAKLEGSLEGLREAIAGRPPPSSQRPQRDG